MSRAGASLVAVCGFALVACTGEPEPNAERQQPTPKGPKELIVGKWESGESWFRFDEGGTYEGSELGVELRGRYRWLDDDHIAMDLTVREDLETQLVRQVEVSEAELRLIEDGGAAVFERVP